jgi:hypothetical protein
MINVANLSAKFPLLVSEEQYEKLRLLKKRGWTQCDSQEEWMVKLHYLRKGYKEKKVDREKFFRLEHDLVIKWLLKQCKIVNR